MKRYVSEIGSVWVLELFHPTFGNEIFIAAVSGGEIIAAIARRSRGGSISATDATTVCNQLRSDLQMEYQIIEITSIINDEMTLAQKHGLRGYDAI